MSRAVSQTYPSLLLCINDLLPTEIISEILLCCTDGPMDHTHTVRIPLKLLWVCQYWRTTALSTPLLWHRLFIRINRAGSLTQSEKTNAWMDRSGDCALTIFVFWEEQPPGVLVTHPALDAMIRHSHRWYHLFAYLPLRAFSCFRSVRGNVPLLRLLSLGSDDFRAHFNSLDAFEIAPKLHLFESINIDPFLFILPWPQLESIPAVSISPLDCLELQTRCPRLKDATFVLSFHIFRTEDQPPPTYFQLEHLHSVNFISSPWATFVDASPIFELATYPNLRSLQLCDLKLAPMPHLRFFLQRSPHLQTLSLRRMNMTESDLLQCLETIPSLTRLEVLEEPQLSFGNVLGEVTLQRLVYRPGDSTNILPRLKHLVVSTSSIPLDPFLDMVESRFLIRDAALPSQLQSVILDTPTDLDEDSAERQFSLCQQGLDIVVAPLSWS